MKFGLSLAGLGPRHYPDVAAVAEECGFDSIWAPEHLIFPAVMPPKYMYTVDGYPPMKPDTPAFDPWVVLGAVASRTTKIRLGTGVFILPLRHPISVARSVITVDRLSGGRVIFGIGVGWMPDEFEIVGEEFRNRGARADEMIDLIRKLWSEETIEYHGEYYDIPPVKFEPKPVNKKDGIPFVVGGTSPAALRRAGRLGDGWTHHTNVRVSLVNGETNPGTNDDDFAQLEDHIKVINQHRADAGRASQSFEFIAGMGTGYDQIRRSESLGVTMANVGPSAKNLRGTKDDYIEWVHRFADDVMSKF